MREPTDPPIRIAAARAGGEDLWPLEGLSPDGDHPPGGGDLGPPDELGDLWIEPRPRRSPERRRRGGEWDDDLERLRARRRRGRKPRRQRRGHRTPSPDW